VLLDENLPHVLRHELVGHDVFTVRFQGWSGMKNGELLRTAAAAGFDVMVTNDSGVPYQQNAASLSLSVVVLQARSNDIEDLRPLVPRLLDALRALTPRSIVILG
jgi:hypothetical protein